MLIEALIAGVACYVARSARSAPPRLATSVAVPFFKDVLFDLGIFFAVFGAFVIVAAGNAVNLTDGLDGLAIVPVMIAAATFGFIAYLAGNAIFANYLQINFVPGTGELAVVCGAMIGAGLGFLWFNAPPAQIFMGDTGSLALGGLLGAIAVATKHEIVLAIVGGLFVLEALSVIIQVASFKLTGQARVPHGADPPPFRAARLVGAAGRRALLDHRLRAGADRPLHPEAEVRRMTPGHRLRRTGGRAVRARRSGLVDGAGARGGRRARGVAWDDSEASRDKARGRRASRSSISRAPTGRASPRSCSRPACR